MEEKKIYDDLLFRRAILIQLEAASPAALPIETVSLGMKLAGFEFDMRELEKAMDYLAQKNYISVSRSEISAAHLRAKLTAEGRDYLESETF